MFLTPTPVTSPAPRQTSSTQRKRRRRALHYHLYLRCLRRSSSNVIIDHRTCGNANHRKQRPHRSPKYTTFSSPAVASTPHIPPTAPPRHHFQVFVKTLTGKTITVTVSPTVPVSTLKVLIFTKTGIPPADQRINSNGKHLVDHANIATYCICPNSLLHLSSVLLGGDKCHALPRRQPKQSSQARAARHRASLQQRQTEYKEGLNRLNRPTFPSAEELQRSSFEQQSSSDSDKRATLRYHFQLAKEIATARQTQRAISKEALQQIKASGIGHVPEDK